MLLLIAVVAVVVAVVVVAVVVAVAVAVAVAAAVVVAVFVLSSASMAKVRYLPFQEKLYYVHTVNCFENATGIVIEVTLVLHIA